MVTHIRTPHVPLYFKPRTQESEEPNLPIGGLVESVGSGGVEVRDHHGRVIAYVLPPNMKETLLELEARQALETRSEELRAAVARRGGRATQEILAELEQFNGAQAEP